MKWVILMDKSILVEKIIKYLQGDNKEIPDKLSDKISLWNRLSLSNVDRYDEDILSTEDKLIRLLLLNKKLTDGEKYNTFKDKYKVSFKNSDKISLWMGDITNIYCDCIVNSTDELVLGPKEVVKDNIDSTIHINSGMRLRKKCQSIMGNNKLEVSEVIITRAYNLPCDFIIHALCPKDNDNKEVLDELRRTYFNILECAKNNMIKIITIPALGTGYNKINKEEGIRVAIDSVLSYLDKNDKYFTKIIFNAYDVKDYEIYERVLLEKEQAKTE